MAISSLQKFNIIQLKLGFLSLLISCLTACGGGGLNNDDDDDVGPAGREVSVNLTYFDSEPDISGDGTKVVFLSGREDSSLKVFTYEVASPVGEAKQLTTEDVGEQIDVAISPDGTLVAFTTVDPDGLSLYVSAFAGGNDLKKLESEEVGEIESIAFSQDSEYLAFVRRSGAKRQLYVVDVANDGTLGTETLLSDEGDNESSPVWVPLAAGQYQIVTKLFSSSSYTQSLISHTFTTGLAGLNREELADDLTLSISVPMAADSTGLFFSLPNRTGTNYLKPVAPAGVKSDRRNAVVNAPYFLDKDGGSEARLDSAGSELINISAPTNGNMAFMLSRETFACPNANDPKKTDITYGTTLLLNDRSTNALTRIIPRPKDASVVDDYSQWIVTNDVCDNDGETEGLVSLDTGISIAKVSADSNLTSYSIVYVTYAAKDLEVRLLTHASGVDKIYDVSENVTK